MMRRTATFGSALILLSLCALSGAAETSSESHPYMSAMRSLSINRSLLTRAEAEYRDLQKQEPQDPTGAVSRRMSDLRYKIQAFNEDAERLRRLIPADTKAEEIPGETPHPVDVEAERRVENRLHDIYQMHEKALNYIAARKFEEAVKIYEGIVLMSPDDDEAYLLLGHTCLAAGHYEKAGDAFHSAIHIDPRNALEIPRLYENILVENPSDDDAMTQLGYANLLLGSVENARRAFEDALAVNPSNMEARKGLLELP